MKLGFFSCFYEYIYTEAVAQTACLCFKQRLDLSHVIHTCHIQDSYILLYGIYLCHWYTCILRVFYVSIDTSFTNFCGQKNVVLTLSLCNFTVRLALGIYKKIFEQINNKWNSGFSRVFYECICTEAVAQTACLCFKQRLDLSHVIRTCLIQDSYFLLYGIYLFHWYTCILRVFYVLIDTSFTKFFGHEKFFLTSNLCNFTVRLALWNQWKKHFQTK